MMQFFHKRDKKLVAIEKEYAVLMKKEARLKQKMIQANQASWKTSLEKKVPDKVYQSLEGAFSKAFSLVFTKGLAVIEKTYNRKDMEETHAVHDYAVQVKGRRKELKRLKRHAARSTRANILVTTVEGIGLGALGIGLPDIMLFVGILLKGIYQTALTYGFSYDSLEEQFFILSMMEASLTKGPDFATKDAKVDAMIEEMPPVKDDDLDQQIQKTASAFAEDLLVLKFVQGLPLLGLLGGAANPVYYKKVMGYVDLKYQKRYLIRLAEGKSIDLSKY